MNLEVVNTVELIDELTKRFERVVFAGMKPAKNESDLSPLAWKYKGGAIEATGLCAMVTALILTDVGIRDLPTSDI